MSEELSAGVKILLERCKTNPDEIMSSKWSAIVESVFNYKETGSRSHYLRGLTEQEIDLLFDELNKLYRTQFDSLVMRNVLRGEEEETKKPKKITLTSAQASMAKKFGITPAQYARQLAALTKEYE